MIHPLPLSSLRSFIGKHLEMEGRDCIAIDILEDGPQFVFMVIGSKSIQADQWGDAHRRTPESFAVDIYEIDGFTPNPLISKLFDSKLTE